MSGSTFAIGLRPELRPDRRARAVAAAVSALPARLFGRRRVRRRCLLPGRVRPRQAPRVRRHFLVWSVVVGFLLGLGDGHRPGDGALRGRDGLLRLAHTVPDRGAARRGRPLHPAAAGGHAGVRGAARAGEVVDVPRSRRRSRISWRPILQIAGLVVIHNVGFYIVFTYLPSYFTKTLDFSKTARSSPSRWRPRRAGADPARSGRSPTASGANRC